MKKLAVIFGGSIGLYSGHFRVFDEIERQFNCSIRRVTPYIFSTKIDNIKVEFRFCIGPTRDNAYAGSKRYLETKWKEIVPVPADELVKKIKTDKVLFLGLCGTFKGKKNEINIPEEFQEILFEGFYIKHKEIVKVKPMNKIKINNFLSNKIKGKKSRVVTSNISLSPDAVEKKSNEHLILLGEKLSKKADVVDKESYQIAQYFKNKIPLGMMLMNSDVITIKEHMMTENNFSPNKEKFNENVIKAIREILKN